MNKLFLMNKQLWGMWQIHLVVWNFEFFCVIFLICSWLNLQVIESKDVQGFGGWTVLMK